MSPLDVIVSHYIYTKINRFEMWEIFFFKLTKPQSSFGGFENFKYLSNSTLVKSLLEAQKKKKKNMGVWLDRRRSENKCAKEQLSVRLSVTSLHIPLGPELLCTVRVNTATDLIRLYLQRHQCSIFASTYEQNETSVHHIELARAAPSSGRTSLVFLL